VSYSHSFSFSRASSVIVDNFSFRRLRRGEKRHRRRARGAWEIRANSDPPSVARPHGSDEMLRKHPPIAPTERKRDGGGKACGPYLVRRQLRELRAANNDRRKEGREKGEYLSLAFSPFSETTPIRKGESRREQEFGLANSRMHCSANGDAGGGREHHRHRWALFLLPRLLRRRRRHFFFSSPVPRSAFSSSPSRASLGCSFLGNAVYATDLS